MPKKEIQCKFLHMFRLSDSCVFIASCLIVSLTLVVSILLLCPSDSCNFDRLETMLLPIQIPIRLSFIFRAISSNSNEHKRFRALTDSWGLLLECRTKVFVSS